MVCYSVTIDNHRNRGADNNKNDLNALPKGILPKALAETPTSEANGLIPMD